MPEIEQVGVVGVAGAKLIHLGVRVLLPQVVDAKAR